MKTNNSQRVVISAVVLAFAVVLYALVIANQKPAENAAQAARFEQAAERSAEQGRSDARPLAARSSSASDGAFTAQPTAALLQSLGTQLHANTQEALQAETALRFTDFLNGLDGSSERIDAIREALIGAYADILAFGVALQQGDIAPAEAAARADPNYVLNQLAGLLSSEELTELETFMESEARESFLSTYSPQLELLDVQLSAEIQDRLLETLFTETYLLVNSNGIGAPSDLVLGFQRQLDAIANTRDSLRASLSTEQFDQADAFLAEQERGLLGAQIIFSTN